MGSCKGQLRRAVRKGNAKEQLIWAVRKGSQRTSITVTKGGHKGNLL